MKLLLPIPAARRPGPDSAFTLLEMMFSVGIYSILLIGVLVAIQIFALRIYTLASTKLSATAGACQAINEIRNDIRQGKYVQVGTCDNAGTNFTAYGGTNLAIGNAIQIFSTTNNNFTSPPYDLYYLQTNTPGGVSSNNLIEMVVTTNSTKTSVLATYITNLDVFSTMNCLGEYTSNEIDNNWVYTVKMQFYQWEYPIAVISTNAAANAYDYYQLRTRVSRRALN